MGIKKSATIFFLTCFLAAAAFPIVSLAADSGEGPGALFCMGNVGLGPLNLASQSPFQSLRLVLTPRPPEILPRGDFEAQVIETLSNVWSFKEDKYMLDYEMLTSRLDVAYGLTDGFLVELAFEDKRYFGGILDGFISDFHDVFSVDQNSRDVYDNGATQVVILDREKNKLISWKGRSAAYSQSLAVTLQHNVTCGGEWLPALSWAVTARYTFWDADEIHYDRPFDIGLSLAMAKKFGDFYAYVAPGFVWYGADRIGDIVLTSTQASLLLGLEWHFSPSWSLLLQYLAIEGACENLGPFSEASHEVSLGFKVRMGRHTLLEAGLLENIIVYANSPDFGVHAGLTRRF